MELPSICSRQLKIQEAREKNKLVILLEQGSLWDSGAPLWWEVGTEILRSLGFLESTNATEALLLVNGFSMKEGKEYNENFEKSSNTIRGLVLIRFTTNCSPSTPTSDYYELR